MNLGIQLLTIVAMFALSYVGLLAFGPPRTALLYTKEEKREWDGFVQSKLGGWLAATNVIGTLTSFATVFLFFLGNSKIFGWATLICCVSIWASALATNRLTRRILAIPRIDGLLRSENQAGGVIASLFWSDSLENRRAASIVKWTSLLNIAGVIWLEFALFADFGGAVLGLDNLWQRALIVGCSGLAISYFVLKFGVRGFVFADLFQTPIIAIATAVIGFGAVFALVQRELSFGEVLEAAKPLMNPTNLMLFVIHVTVLNFFLVVATEPHWLRAWFFRDRESQIQAKATLGTSIIWLMLILFGWVATSLSGGAVGQGVVTGLLSALGEVSPIFLSAFWFAGIAALFSTADTQLYSFLLVAGFDRRTGTLAPSVLGKARPLGYAVLAGAALTTAYVAVRASNLPFEKLVFLIIPMCLNVVPGLVSLALAGKPAPGAMLLSIVGYSAFAISGLLQPQHEFALTMSAALVPALVAGVVAIRSVTSKGRG